jgi:hypothetical protein
MIDIGVESKFPLYAVNTSKEGTSLRDEFAGKAMAAIIGNEELMEIVRDWASQGITRFAALSVMAYQIADAMLEERERDKSGDIGCV